MCFQNLNKEPAQSRWAQGSQAQVNRAGRRNYSPKPLSHGEQVVTVSLVQSPHKSPLQLVDEWLYAYFSSCDISFNHMI